MPLKLVDGLPGAADGAAAEEQLGRLAQVLSLRMEANVSAGLVTDGQENLPLGDGGEV